jgi:ABC-type polysaccharide/polyol phosphate export permease
MRRISQDPRLGRNLKIMNSRESHFCSHVLTRLSGLELTAPKVKVLAKSSRPWIFLGVSGLPKKRTTTPHLVFTLRSSDWVCSYCGLVLSSVFKVFGNRLNRSLAKLSFWGQLATRHLTLNTRIGYGLVLAKSVLTLLFLSSMLIFSQATNPVRSISSILYSFGLWVLFEMGISRASLTLNTFGSLSKELRSSSLLLTSAAYLTTVVDLVLLNVIIGIYSMLIGNISMMNTLIASLYFIFSYLVLLVPAFSLSLLISRLNRNYRDLRHILPWLLRLVLFTIPIFSLGPNPGFEFIRFISQFSPITFPFQLMSYQGNLSSNFLEIGIIPYAANLFVLILIYLKRK